MLRVLGELAPPRGHRLLTFVTGAAREGRVAESVALPTPFDGRADNLAKLLFEQAHCPPPWPQGRADLLYSPYFSLPLAGADHGVITVHDMIPLLLPEYAPSRPIQAYFKLVIAAARRARAVITVSEHARGDITRVLGVAPERVHVVPEGADDALPPSSPTEMAGAAVRRRYGLPERFVLYLGGGDTRKNVGVLLDALATLGRPLSGRRAPAGRGGAVRGRAYSPLFPDLRAQRGPPGPGPAGTFRGLGRGRRQASALRRRGGLLLSLVYEGFGLPPLEAMSCGTPVLCSRATSLPEVVGDGGLLLDPLDAAAWAELWCGCVATATAADLAMRGPGPGRAL